MLLGSEAHMAIGPALVRFRLLHRKRFRETTASGTSAKNGCFFFFFFFFLFVFFFEYFFRRQFQQVHRSKSAQSGADSYCPKRWRKPSSILLWTVRHPTPARQCRRASRCHGPYECGHVHEGAKAVALLLYEDLARGLSICRRHSHRPRRPLPPRCSGKKLSKVPPADTSGGIRRSSSFPPSRARRRPPSPSQGRAPAGDTLRR
mmetsp:Transcript_3765/g.14752  ORF Transcript_3765/g.14752 Transcript_3765/m.14752 type:complete len:204 (-) Transcript_3765:556-1167(-)